VPLPRVGDAVTLSGGPSAPGRRVRQQITFVGVDSDVLLAGGRPLAFSGSFPTPLSLVGGTVRLPSPLRRGDGYSAVSLVPDVAPAALGRERRYAPGEVSARLVSLIAGPHGPLVTMPVWGSRSAPPAASAFGEYAEVARLARRLARGATSPYEVVSRFERYLRSGYAYDERPPLPPQGRAPLVDFLFHTRRGFCQHFAGAMALMLRTVGIPSRVAVGYTNGDYDPGTRSFQVLDRDAHSWVEVLFPRDGWLPFDPTPGRSVPNRASASSPDFELPSAAAASRGPAPRLSLPEPRLPLGQTSGGPASRPTATHDGIATWLWAGLGLAAALLLPAGARRLRREGRRRRGGERARVLGAVRELEGRAADLGVALGPTLSPLERCAGLRARLGIDAERLYRLATAARFAPSAPAAGAARSAWAERRRLVRALRRRVGWRRRARALVSLSSLRPWRFPSGRRGPAPARGGSCASAPAPAPRATTRGGRPG
jgi:transglutaminase-like putative cysteine protease